MGRKQNRRREHLYLFFACILILFLMTGCVHLTDGLLSRTDFEEARDLAGQGNYEASLNRYEKILAQRPAAGDRALFEIGVIYATPGNQKKDYHKSLECFQKIAEAYPASAYRKDSDAMIYLIQEITSRDKRMGAQRRQLERLEQQIEQLKEVDMKLRQQKKPLPGR